MEQITAFGVTDYVVFALMLGVSAAIGIYYRLTGGKQKTTQEYLLGDRNLAILPVAFSLMASFMSAITLLGVSMENYTYGTQFVIINISYGFGTPIAVYCFLPVFFKLQATSAYEYLQLRFGLATRLVCSIAFSIQMILYMGIVLYAPALALSAVTSLSLLTAILSMGIVCTFYSTIGGMKAVITTDVFQSLLMFAAVFSIIVKAAIDLGGLDEIWKIAEEGGRIEFFNFNPDPRVRHTFWSLTIGGMFTFLSLYACNQAQVQRLLTLKNLKASQMALWLNWPILTCLSLSTSFAGLAIYSRYYKCDPVKEKRISSPDQLMPLFVVETMGLIPGLSGLFVAGLFSGSLSTVSSALNSLSAVSLEDYIKPLYLSVKRRPLSEKTSTILSKILVLSYGMLCLAFAFLAQSFGGVLQASLTIFGVVGGPLLGVFTLGMFIPIANQVGAVVGLLLAVMISLWIGFGGPKPPLPRLPISTEGCLITSNITEEILSNATVMPTNSTAVIEEDYFILYEISYLWYVVIAFAITVIVGIVVSLIAHKICGEWSMYSQDPDLFCPFVSKWMRKRLRRKSKHADGIVTLYELPVPCNGSIKHTEENHNSKIISKL